jgi:hypothetical protein
MFLEPGHGDGETLPFSRHRIKWTRPRRRLFQATMGLEEIARRHHEQKGGLCSFIKTETAIPTARVNPQTPISTPLSAPFATTVPPPVLLFPLVPLALELVKFKYKLLIISQNTHCE